MKTNTVFWIVVMVIIIMTTVFFQPASFLQDTSWIKALTICVLHYFAPQIRPHLRKYEPYVNSFAGGMAVTYIFGHLLPEIDEGHEVVGELIYLLILLGFVVYYGLERRLRLSQQKQVGNHELSAFTLSMSGYWIYNFLIVFGIPASISASPFHLALVTVAMGLHLLHSDFEMGSKHPQLFDNYGRYLLVGAILAGYFCRFLQPDSELFRDSMTAFLAGSIIYSVFKKELPHPEQTSVKWFLIGIITYTLLLILLLKGV